MAHRRQCCARQCGRAEWCPCPRRGTALLRKGTT
jgi:hypothetical protein